MATISAIALYGCWLSPEGQFLESAQKAVADRMKDPSSAKFRSVGYMDNKEWLPVACGEVNSKNGFGAYAGFDRFIATNSGLTFMESQGFGEMSINGVTVASFSDFWGRVCLQIPIAPVVINTDTATLAEYDSLHEGASLAEAQDVIGAPGHVLARSVDVDGVTLVQQWNNADLSTMSITFRNDSLTNKAQGGLK